MSLTKITDLPSAPKEEQAAAFALLFEPCAPLVELATPAMNEPAQSWNELIERVRTALHTLVQSTPPNEDPRIVAIIAAHPRLGAAKVESASSQAEQKSLQAASEEEAQALSALNAQYEKTFPGLRYVVFVAGRPRSIIMEDMRRRIDEGDREKEKLRAVNAMCDIARDRAEKHLTSKI